MLRSVLSSLSSVTAIVVMLAALPSLARAADGPAGSADVEAHHHFDEGTKLFNLGEFVGAIVEYKAAYKARPDPVFLYNIAQAYRQSNDLAQAVFFYCSYLRTAPRAENRQEVEERVRKLDIELAAQKAAANAPPNAAVAPGGKPVTAPEPPQPVTPPPASVESTPPPSSTTAPSNSEPTVAASPALVAEAPPPRHTSIAKKWWLWTAVGVVVVGVGVGVGLGLTLGGGHASSPPSSQNGTSPVF